MFSPFSMFVSASASLRK